MPSTGGAEREGEREREGKESDWNQNLIGDKTDPKIPNTPTSPYHWTMTPTIRKIHIFKRPIIIKQKARLIELQPSILEYKKKKGIIYSWRIIPSFSRGDKTNKPNKPSQEASFLKYPEVVVSEQFSWFF